MTRSIFAKQKMAASATEFRLFEDRSHFTCIEPGWEEIADFALEWALAHSGNITPFARSA